MVLITSPAVRFHCQRSVVQPQRYRHYHRVCRISAIDLCKLWPITDRCKLRTQEKLRYVERCLVRRRPETAAAVKGEDDRLRRVLRYLLWTVEAVYIVWLFLLPYAPGDPVWAISSETVKSLVGLSLNFFFILPLTNAGMFNLRFGIALISVHGLLLLSVITINESYWNELYGRAVGIRFLEAPILHPMAEGLFNFVVAWTLMFAPLLYTDCKRNRYKNSLDVLWGLMMFLTNTFLIPYMAIRLNDADPDGESSERSRLGNIMTNGAAIVGLTGAAVCLISGFWGLYGRAEDGFGGVMDRWQYLIGYLESERLAYAFIWDICLYTIFQPWLISDNLQNVRNDKLVKYLSFVPVVGLLVYLLCLKADDENL